MLPDIVMQSNQAVEAAQKNTIENVNNPNKTTSVFGKIKSFISTGPQPESPVMKFNKATTMDFYGGKRSSS